MNYLTVIYPSTNNEQKLKMIQGELEEGDEFISFRPKSATFCKEMNDYIKNAKNNQILIINPRDTSFSNKTDFIDKFRDDGSLLNFATQSNGEDIIAPNSSYKFNKEKTKLPNDDRKLRNVKEYCRFIDKSFHKTRKVRIRRKVRSRMVTGQKVSPPPISPSDVKKLTVNKDSGKPKVLIVCDVEGGAWWIKSNYLKKYLSEYYDIDVINLLEQKYSNMGAYDLCFTYGYYFVTRLRGVPYRKKITGITAHRPINILRPRMKMAYATHANSLLLYKELAQMHNNTFYVPNGVDPDLFKMKTPLFDNGEIVFGHVGKLSPRKGQQEYIEPAMKKANVQYFSHYNNHKNRIPHERMVNIHQNYDVFVVASEEDGTPCPGLEAAACGRPIISNKIGNMPELIENYKTGILLDKRSVDLYVDAIKGCRKNPEKVEEMSQNIRKKIEEEGTWELMARNYLYMFDTLLKVKREPEVYENPARYHIMKK